MAGLSMKLVIFSVYFISYISLSNSTCLFQDDNNNNNNNNLEGNENMIKGMFVFGSSLVDNGNNNFFESKAKADYLPYGIDFPMGPTGRFTNGRNLVDLLAQTIQLPNFMIPSFRDPSTKGTKIIYGVNHASGSSGILDDTGLNIAGNVTSLSQQIRDFEEETLPNLEAMLECNRSEALPNYLFVVGVGGNDVVFKYFLNGAFLRTDIRTFVANLISTLSTHLQKLYNNGARKFVLTTIYPLGNCPMVELNMPNCGAICKNGLNQAAELYNNRLNLLVQNMEKQLPASRAFIIDTYNIVRQIVSDPASKGFTVLSRSCCQVLSRNQGGNGIMCERGGQTCRDRNAYVYYDALHPTEAVNIQIANQAFASHNLKFFQHIN